MNFIDRLKRGWTLGLNSLEVIGSHPKLLLFPILSGAAMVAVLLSFGGLFLGLTGFDWAVLEAVFQRMEQYGEVVFYAVGFLFYLVTYFIIIFFNVALVYNARLIFAGEEPSIRDGIAFSAARAPKLLAWAALAATVGTILQAIEERVGSFASSILGFAWSLATYFVVPTLAAEDIGPVEALKKSSRTIREKWGETVGAGFSLGLFVLLGIVISLLTGFVMGYLIHPGAGVVLGFLTFFLTLIVNGAARNVFLMAAYEHTHGNTPEAFDREALDGVFMEK